MPGAPLSANEIIDRFNTIVRDRATSIDNAHWFRGNFPRSPNDDRLGQRTEIRHSGADLANAGHLAATVVFNILHGFAMELTRVRRVRAFHLTDNAPIRSGISMTALNSNHAAYFPIPFQPTVGEVATEAQLTNFLNALRMKVNEIRTSDDFRLDIVTCHNSCHSSCHGSRNRR